MKSLRSAVLLLFWVSVAVAQQPHAPTESQPQKPAAEHTISAAEAAELLRSVDEVTRFVSQATGLPQKQPIKREIAKREAVEKLIRDRLLEDDNLERFKRSESVLKKFGLIPRDFDLENFLIRLMKEQAAGFYNFRDRTVYLLDWIEEEAQKPVLAHELMHALQDQNFDVENWLDGLPAGTSREERRRRRNRDVEQPDDESSARQAILEGQGMTVMLDYLLSPSGQTIVTAPQVVAMFEATTMQESDKSPELSAAPVFIREWLIFPYTAGMRFVHHVMMQKGKAAAYMDLMANPPASTLHVMYPELYLAGMNIPELKLPDIQRVLGSEWEHFDTGAMGAFDVAAMTEQFGDDKVREELTSGWRGGRYYAVRRAGNPARGGGNAAVVAVSPADIALLYVSRWDSEKTAASFAGAYAGWLPQRYAQVSATADPCKCRWKTAEGTVAIHQQGDTVLVLEGFDDASAARARAAIFQQDEVK